MMLGAALTAGEYLGRLAAKLGRVDAAAAERLCEVLYRAWESEKFVFLFGNGGSGATASHLSEDLGKSIHLCVLHWAVGRLGQRMHGPSAAAAGQPADS